MISITININLNVNIDMNEIKNYISFILKVYLYFCSKSMFDEGLIKDSFNPFVYANFIYTFNNRLQINHNFYKIGFLFQKIFFINFFHDFNEDNKR